MPSYRVKELERNDTEFFGRYKGHDIAIERDEATPDEGFYIVVKDDNGGTLYDGWWGDASFNMEEAIEEALSGSQLIVENQRKFTFARNF